MTIPWSHRRVMVTGGGGFLVTAVAHRLEAAGATEIFVPRSRESGLDWEKYVRVDPAYFRPTEVEELCGDASKASEKLGWRSEVRFTQLVSIMLGHDLREAGVPDGTFKEAAPR